MPKRGSMAAPPTAAVREAIQQEAEVSKRLSFSAEADPGAGEAVEVFLRIRPLTAAAAAAGATSTLAIVDPACVTAAAPPDSQAFKIGEAGGRFGFTHVFDPAADQGSVFDRTTRGLVDALFDGRSGLMFCYGITNAGKTHTILGSDAQPGILPRALERVFDKLARRGGDGFSVALSCLEIYNESVYDLLVAAREGAPLRARDNLKLQDINGKVLVKGLTQPGVDSLDAARAVVQTATRNRQTSATNLNLDSSRGHTVYTVQLTGPDGRQNQLWIVDLAGSERSTRTGARGRRLREASMINTSLMHLMQCIEAIRWNQTHPPTQQRVVPFRDTKLTRLFREQLVGSSAGKTVMVVNASAAPADYDETVHTLKYGALAREITVKRLMERRSATNSGAQYGMDGRRAKRGADKPVEELQSEEEAAAEDEPAEEDRDATQTNKPRSINALRRDNVVLRRKLAEMAEQMSALETEIRDEVSAEMAARLEEMEQQYQAMRRSGSEATEDKYKRKMQLLVRAQKGAVSADDVEQLVEQIVECEEEMTRMRARNAEVVQRLTNEVLELRNRRRASSAGSAASQAEAAEAAAEAATAAAVDELQAQVDALQAQLQAKGKELDVAKFEIAKARATADRVREEADEALAAERQERQRLTERFEELQRRAKEATFPPRRRAARGAVTAQVFSPKAVEAVGAAAAAASAVDSPAAAEEEEEEAHVEEVSSCAPSPAAVTPSAVDMSVDVDMAMAAAAAAVSGDEEDEEMAPVSDVAEVVAEVVAEPEAVVEPEAVAEPEVEVEAEAQPEPETEPQPEPQTQLQTYTGVSSALARSAQVQRKKQKVEKAEEAPRRRSRRTQSTAGAKPAPKQPKRHQKARASAAPVLEPAPAPLSPVAPSPAAPAPTPSRIPRPTPSRQQEPHGEQEHERDENDSEQAQQQESKGMLRKFRKWAGGTMRRDKTSKRAKKQQPPTPTPAQDERIQAEREAQDALVASPRADSVAMAVSQISFGSPAASPGPMPLKKSSATPIARRLRSRHPR